MKVTPVPIPNTTVKLHRADGTAGEALWESMTLPGNKIKGAVALTIKKSLEKAPFSTDFYLKSSLFHWILWIKLKNGKL